MQRKDLRRAYANKVSERDARVPYDWKIKQRSACLEKLRAQGCHNMLEIGSGPGQDAVFFHHEGIQLFASDLTPENAQACQQKGLAALACDALHQPFTSQSFDAAYSINCLLHLPKKEMPFALKEIQRILRPGAPFFFTVWGGIDQEGVYEEDNYTPKRFFAFHTDEALIKLLLPHFSVESFERFSKVDSEIHAQSFFLIAKEYKA